ncbi:sushi domain-containing protein 3 isoform X3 [Tamandua tetradactyla]|uniref:sushi domain-containing protein 3 isoform X3 n=1 Tax=Tamandua tetradactyla TaxID=48850 RepID=UPI0040539CB4
MPRAVAHLRGRARPAGRAEAVTSARGNRTVRPPEQLLSDQNQYRTAPGATAETGHIAYPSLDQLDRLRVSAAAPAATCGHPGREPSKCFAETARPWGLSSCSTAPRATTWWGPASSPVPGRGLPPSGLRGRPCARGPWRGQGRLEHGAWRAEPLRPLEPPPCPGDHAHREPMVAPTCLWARHSHPKTAFSLQPGVTATPEPR